MDHFGKGGSLCLFVVAGPQAHVTCAQHVVVFLGLSVSGPFLQGENEYLDQTNAASLTLRNR